MTIAIVTAALLLALLPTLAAAQTERTVTLHTPEGCVGYTGTTESLATAPSAIVVGRCRNGVIDGEAIVLRRYPARDMVSVVKFEDGWVNTWVIEELLVFRNGTARFERQMGPRREVHEFPTAAQGLDRWRVVMREFEELAKNLRLPETWNDVVALLDRHARGYVTGEELPTPSAARLTGAYWPPTWRPAIASAATSTGSMPATQSGCRVSSPAPAADVMLHWNGPCGADGLASGRGTLEFRSPRGTTSYQGEMRAGKREGAGVHTYLNGNRLESTWVDDRQQGKASLVFTSGTRLEGDFVNFRLQGRGTMTWPNGDRYEGDFSADGKRTGKGVYTRPSGMRYEGELLDGRFHGRGVLVHANGDRYEGPFENGRCHGRGLYTFKNGDRYDGPWVQDRQHGKGYLITPDGKRWEREYVEGRLVRDAYASAQNREVAGEAAGKVFGALLEIVGAVVEQRTRETTRPPARTQTPTPSAPSSPSSPGVSSPPPGSPTPGSRPSTSPPSSASRDHSGAAATHCISMEIRQKTGGYTWATTNSCQYMVSFNYCVERSSTAVQAAWACDYSAGGRHIEAGETVEIDYVRGVGQADIRFHACRWASDAAYNAIGIKDNKPFCQYHGRRQ